MPFSFPQRTSWFFVFLLLLPSACETRAPYLTPVSPDIESPSESNQVIVEVKPVETSGFGNKERERLGIDLSAYFTAFEVSIQNRTAKAVSVEDQAAALQDASGISNATLSDEESLAYYRSDDPSRVEAVLIPKSSAVAQKEMEKIRRLRLKAGEIPAGESVDGILLFRKVPPDQCRTVSLVFKGIRISGESGNREFRFVFSCGGS